MSKAQLTQKPLSNQAASVGQCANSHDQLEQAKSHETPNLANDWISLTNKGKHDRTYEFKK